MFRLMKLTPTLKLGNSKKLNLWELKLTRKKIEIVSLKHINKNKSIGMYIVKLINLESANNKLCCVE